MVRRSQQTGIQMELENIDIYKNMVQILFEIKRLQKLAGILTEETRNVSYTGIVLTRQAHENLVSMLEDKIPEGWEIIAHHSTVNMGSFKGDRELLNSEQQLTTNTFAINDKVCAVSIIMPSDISSNNANPHITIAVNRNGGGKPVMSNKLNWSEAIPVESIILNGKLIEVAQGENLFADDYNFDISSI